MNLDNIELIEPIDDGTIDDSPPEGVSPDLWKIWQDEEELKKDKFLWQLKRGMLGHNVGLDNGSPGLSKYIYGTHKGRYYLFGGDSGTGKTTIVDFMYVLKAWESAKKMGKRIKIYYFSFEIGKIEKLYKWCSYFIFIKFGVRLSSQYCQGMINGMVPTQEHARMILIAYSAVTEILKDVVIIEDVMHPTKIFEAMVEEHFAKEGKVIRNEVTAEEKKKNPNKKGYVKDYTENDPQLVTLMIIDHLALTGQEMGLDTKGIMDKMSKYAIVLRNLFHCTIAIVQQFSTSMMETYRGTFGRKTEGSIAPQRIDFGDSRATFRDCECAFGIVKPQNDMPKFMEYNLTSPYEDGLGDYFVAAYLMKNRYGPSNRMVPLFLDPIAGLIYDLPTTDLTNPFTMQEWVEKAKDIEKTCQLFAPKSK